MIHQRVPGYIDTDEDTIGKKVFIIQMAPAFDLRFDQLARQVFFECSTSDDLIATVCSPNFSPGHRFFYTT